MSRNKVVSDLFLRIFRLGGVWKIISFDVSGGLFDVIERVRILNRIPMLHLISFRE